DFDLFMRNGAREIRIITLATNAVPVSSSSVPSVEYGSIGLGVGLGLGLLLAAALGSVPGRRENQRGHEPPPPRGRATAAASRSWRRTTRTVGARAPRAAPPG